MSDMMAVVALQWHCRDIARASKDLHNRVRWMSLTAFHRQRILVVKSVNFEEGLLLAFSVFFCTSLPS